MRLLPFTRYRRFMMFVYFRYAYGLVKQPYAERG